MSINYVKITLQLIQTTLDSTIQLLDYNWDTDQRGPGYIV